MNWIARLRDWYNRPDPLRVELRRNRELTTQLCATMEEFERTVIRYQSRSPTKYGRRCDDNKGVASK